MAAQGARYDQFGRDIYQLFIRVFAHRGGTWPNPRPSAEEWNASLRTASDWTMECSCCGLPSVGRGRATCPFCGAAIAHAQLELPGGGQILIDDDVYLPFNSLGVGGDQPAAAFERKNGKLLITPFGRVRLGGDDRLPGHPPYSPRRGRWSLEVISPDGLRLGRATLVVP